MAPSRVRCAHDAALASAFPHTPMPEHGLPRGEVMQQLITMKQDDQDWRGGRVFWLVYSAGDDVHELLSDALSLYSAENGLNVLAFPSIGDHAARHRDATPPRCSGRTSPRPAARSRAT